MTLPDVLIPTFRQMLGALSAWLDKAEAQRPAEAILSARLTPDMYPLATQIRFACVQVREAVARLQGEPFGEAITVLLDEGRNAGDHPGSLAEARMRIAETLAVLEEFAAAPPMVDGQAPLAHGLPNGMTFDFTAEQYVRDWALSQFYFHLMTAYAILRAQGIELGKADYVAHLFPYLRGDAASA